MASETELGEILELAEWVALHDYTHADRQLLMQYVLETIPGWEELNLQTVMNDDFVKHWLQACEHHSQLHQGIFFETICFS